MFDTHTHTNHSHDSKCPLPDSIAAAKAKGISGLTVTDHCDIEYVFRDDVKTPVLESFDEVFSQKESEKDLKLLTGVEFGEAIWYPEETEKIANARPFDTVYCSVHAARFDQYERPYSGIDFAKMPKNLILPYLHRYFDDVYETVSETGTDVLTHLTCPWRYIKGKFRIDVPLEPFSEEIDRILQKIVDRRIALEVNTSCKGGGYDRFMPDRGIVLRYLEKGGEMLTLGSDAHIAENIAHDFEAAVLMLKDLGVKKLYYFENRTPKVYGI